MTIEERQWKKIKSYFSISNDNFPLLLEKGSPSCILLWASFILLLPNAWYLFVISLSSGCRNQLACVHREQVVLGTDAP